MTHLFLFTLTPVQSFISQARKTQDLWAGSKILSELTEAGINAFGAANIIFPNVSNNSKPNRFLGKIANCDDLKGLGEKVEKAVRDKFKALSENALKNAGKEHNKPSAFDTQIENHLEIFWVFEPIADDTNEAYKTAYQNIERNLGAIKNVRTFKQMPESGRKCSLDGERNALFFGQGTNSKFWTETKWNKQSGAVELGGTDEVKVAKGEGLSAVSLTKRFYGSGGFPSTAKIALMHDINKLENSKDEKDADAKIVFACYKKFFSDKDFDEQLLFEENLTQKYFENHGLEKYLDKLPNIIANHNKIKKYLKTNYYALLVFDGDKMGKMLSGELLQDQNADLQAYQNKISSLLGTYANWAKGYLDERNNNGQAVYAGGDDFLGFVNLHHLFAVLQELRQRFDTEVNQELQKVYPLQEDFTFSAGICIAHYKTPLNIVLKTAKAMEHKAKEDVAKGGGGRNAFAISVLKRSGESHETVLTWEQNVENLIRIKEITESLQNDFSANWIKNIQEEFRLIPNEKGMLELTHREMFKTEMKRLLSRSCNLTGEAKAKKVANLSGKADLLLASVDYHFHKFSELLNISKFINKELKNQ
ncbi:type III-B CRISPR-associated protein Cas10/Cmr2 [Rhodoflexus caldus]|uniref:type III-B CRISPR-associated protein Cas10/Cmr2 n=1 Tax=Rhodoflexus caldus TaxID=2891236 RepID=UPI002029BE35|nr:type III-B CRISPR-associated protein Cas10/Cmr2 [Rhodoflexus caldus]